MSLWRSSFHHSFNPSIRLPLPLRFDFVESPLTKNFSASHLTRQDPPYWTHEDAGVGYLIFHSAILQVPNCVSQVPCTPFSS